MNKDELDKFKNYPEGSGGKKIYDQFTMPFPFFLAKYYKGNEPENWSYIYKKFIAPLFNNDERDSYIDFLQKAKPRFIPDMEKALAFFKEISLDKPFSDDVKKFFSFLFSINFFRDLTFNEWLSVKYWRHPWHKESDDSLLSLNEIIQFENAENYLKEQLSQLSIF
jgi:hypothetical protein